MIRSLSYKIKRYASYLEKIAKKDVEYNYSCLMVNLPKELSSDIIQWGKKHISDKLLVDDDKKSMGREDEIHITLFYGIKSADPKESFKILKKEKPFEVRLGLINLFKDKDDYDVIKIQVESPDLERLHYDIEDKIDNANSYPTYIPHITIAYVKKDSYDNLIGESKFKGKTFKVNDITFSSLDGSDKYLSLNT